jgi:SAM-dependent methyltransferase
MPTLPKGQRDSPGPAHRDRAMAESFGVDPDRYDRARPAYPGALIAQIRTAAPGPEVLDVGCGTGIESRQLRDRGCRVLGVEPDLRMAEFARRRGTAVEVSTFETWEPAGRSFDAVVAGTAWHWVDPVAGAGKAADVLRPGGLLAPFWHVSTTPSGIHQAFADAFDRVAPESPVKLHSSNQGLRGYRPILEQAAAGMRQTGRFSEPEEWVFEWDQSYSRVAWLDQLATSGILTRLDPRAVREVQEAVGRVIDAAGGSLIVHYDSAVVAAHLVDG